MTMQTPDPDIVPGRCTLDRMALHGKNDGCENWQINPCPVPGWGWVVTVSDSIGTEGRTFEFLSAPDEPRSHLLVSSVRIEPRFKHAAVSVWNRGGGSGSLVVDRKDALCLSAIILGVEDLTPYLSKDQLLFIQG